MGRRLADVLPDAELVARLGGDEFAIVCPGADPDPVTGQAEALLAAMCAPLPITDLGLTVSLSIGIASSYPERVHATNGVQAISVAARERPDVVLLDVGLPDGDGLTVLERYARQSGLSGIPVFVLTGRDPRTAEPAVQKFHVLAFLRKPVENHLLLDAPERALRGESTPPAYAAIAPSAWNG